MNSFSHLFFGNIYPVQSIQEFIKSCVEEFHESQEKDIGAIRPFPATANGLYPFLADQDLFE